MADLDITADLQVDGAPVTPANPVPSSDATAQAALALLLTEATGAAIQAAVDAVRTTLQVDALTSAERAAQDPATDTSVQAVTAAVQALTAPQTDALTDTQLRATPVAVSGTQTDALTDTQLRAVVPDEVGTWSYAAGTSGSASPTGRVLLITATAPDDADASMTIDGGDTVTIPAGRSISVEPRANLTDPALVFTGTDAYFIQLLA